MSTSSRISSPAAATEAGEAPAPERVRQGITATIVGRLTADPEVREKLTTFSVAANVPRKSPEGRPDPYQVHTTFVRTAAFGDAHQEFAGGRLGEARKGSLVEISGANLELSTFTTSAGVPGSSLDAKLFRAGAVKVLSQPKGTGAARAGTSAADAGDEPPY